MHKHRIIYVLALGLLLCSCGVNTEQSSKTAKNNEEIQIETEVSEGVTDISVEVTEKLESTQNEDTTDIGPIVETHDSMPEVDDYDLDDFGDMMRYNHDLGEYAAKNEHIEVNDELREKIRNYVDNYIGSNGISDIIDDTKRERMIKIATLFARNDDQIQKAFDYDNHRIGNYLLTTSGAIRFEANSDGLINIDDISIDQAEQILSENSIEINGKLLSPLFSYTMLNIEDKSQEIELGPDVRLASFASAACFQVDKPVIYLYPSEKEQINVKLVETDNEKLSFTYPIYNENTGWNVIADTTGKITNIEDNKVYDYLFYEASAKIDDVNSVFNEGFIVTGDSAIEFLENKLDEIGLTQSEKTEFIVYWGPILAKHDYSIVNFEFDSDLKLDISPKPDNVYRLFINILPINSPIKIAEQDISSRSFADRHGFTVVEWGGTLYK